MYTVQSKSNKVDIYTIYMYVHLFYLFFFWKEYCYDQDSSTAYTNAFTISSLFSNKIRFENMRC